MCRLLGVISNKPVDVRFSLKHFKEYSKENPDGWGIGWYEGNRARTFREAVPAKESTRLPLLAREVASRIVVVHVRKGTGAPPAEENSHPFRYKNWIFAHNGSVDKNHLLPLLREKHRKGIRGETDSEVYFRWLLQNIEEYGTEEGIERALAKVVEGDHTGLNFLLSDGKRLYAFRYASDSRAHYSLYKLHRPGKTLRGGTLYSSETGMLIEGKLERGERAILVCSERLTEEEWEEVGLGRLLILSCEEDGPRCRERSLL